MEEEVRVRVTRTGIWLHESVRNTVGNRVMFKVTDNGVVLESKMATGYIIKRGRIGSDTLAKLISTHVGREPVAVKIAEGQVLLTRREE